MDIEHIISKLELRKSWLLVVAIFCVGFSTVYLSHGPRLSDPDAWFQYKMARYVLEDGGVPKVYDLAYFPQGRRPWIQDTLLLPYFFAYTYKLAAFLGFSIMEYAMLFPAIFGGGLAAVALYLAAKELFDRRTALLSALIYAFMPLSLSRVYSGTIDKEVLYGVFTYTSFYFFLKSYKQGISLKMPRSLGYPVLAGVFYGLAYANWSGGAYIILVISVAAVIHFLFEWDLNLMKAIGVMTLVGPWTMHLIQPDKFGVSYFARNFNVFLPLAVSLLPLASTEISSQLRDRGREIPHLQVMGGIIVSLVIGLFIIGQGDIVLSFINAPRGMIAMEKGAQRDLYMATVAESQPSRLFGPGETTLQRIMNGDFFRELGLSLFVIPAGVLLLLLRFRERRDFFSAFTFVWILSGFLAANQGLRLLFFMAPSASVIVGYTFVSLYARVKEKESEVMRTLNSTSKKRVIQRAERRLTNIRVAHLVLIVSLLLATMSTLSTATAFRNFSSDLPRPWYEATMWFRDETPEDSVIFFWWDYGYYFQALSGKYTIADGGGNVLRNINLANMFTSPEEEAIKYIRKYVDYEKTPTYILVSYEEFGKSGAINRIAGGDPETGAIRYDVEGRMKDGQLYIVNFQVPRTGDPKRDEQNLGNALAGGNPYRMPFSTYYIVNRGDSYLVWALVQFDGNGNFHPEWAEKLLVKLLPFNTGGGQGLKHFELVYHDQWNYIFIYRVK
jgi:asparagine N-glycosylation enzyme membrane subunit Stt3